jgi:hypothetical protein
MEFPKIDFNDQSACFKTLLWGCIPTACALRIVTKRTEFSAKRPIGSHGALATDAGIAVRLSTWKTNSEDWHHAKKKRVPR